MKDINEFMKDLNKLVETPFVTANFGDNWKEYASENISNEDAINIAWIQGRKAILLERALREHYKK